jgi:ubiquinol-cytochrome c reductase iron-sulfur subunit
VDEADEYQASPEDAAREAQPEGLMVVGQELPPPSEVNDLLTGSLAALSGLGAVVFGLGLVLEWPMAVFGSGLAVALLALAVAVRRYFAAAYPDVEALEPRLLPARESEIPLAEVRAVRRPATLPRRLLILAAGLFGISLAAPVASLGPSPSGALGRTAWRRGALLVTSTGDPIRPDEVAEGGISTVWPEGAINTEDSAVVLVRLGAVSPEPPTVLDWVVDGDLVAYSKICTHAACPVGLFREQEAALFCPCHQSTFDAARGAVPTFGPAARALPQLPMALNEDGFLVALGDFQNPVGPAFG